MEFIGSILIMMGRVLLYTLTSPSFIFIYISLFLLVVWQYKRLQNISANPSEFSKNIYLQSALASTLFGILGGMFGSILLVFLGIDLSGIGVTQLWLVAIVLMLIKPRFLCFAYAAGLIAASKLLFGYPNINIPELMGLVAVLHMVESMLILLNGSFRPIPVYVKKNGQVRGGFNLQLFWPIPLVALLSMGFIDAGAGGIVMPDWWPLLRGYTPFASDMTYGLVPVLAVLGYGEVSTTRTPRQATRKSSLYLFLFSIILLLLSIISSRWAYFLPLAAIFSPLGHELVIWLGMRDENRRAIYVQQSRGIMILEVIPGTPAANTGLRSQDIILTVNGEMVNQYYAFEELLTCGWKEIILEVNRQGKMISIPLKRPIGSKLGIIPVPEQHVNRYLDIDDDSIFSLVRAMRRKLRK